MGPVWRSTNGYPATSDVYGKYIRFDLSLDYRAATRIALAASEAVSEADLAEAVGLFQAMGKQVSVIEDVPGMIVARTIAMIIDFAVDAAARGVASPEDIDTAMRLGVNYPGGPMEWAERLGAQWVWDLLDSMHHQNARRTLRTVLGAAAPCRPREIGALIMTMAKRDTYTPDSLLAVAVEVFIERGYDGTSMEHLSKAAGISKSSIYHHVRSKEELLQPRGKPGARRAVRDPGGAGRRPGAGDRAARARHPPHGRGADGRTALRDAAAAGAGQHGHRALGAWSAAGSSTSGSRSCSRPAAADGDLRADVDIRLATRLLFGMINSLVEWYRPAARRRSEPDQVADAVVRTAFAGLRKA